MTDAVTDDFVEQYMKGLPWSFRATIRLFATALMQHFEERFTKAQGVFISIRETS